MSGKTITRADLCEAVYQRLGLSRAESADLVELVLRDESGEHRVARGISQYSAVDVRRIARRHSREIASILGYDYGGNVVHRDDLVLL